jgi:hypothetical protein
VLEKSEKLLLREMERGRGEGRGEKGERGERGEGRGERGEGVPCKNTRVGTKHGPHERDRDLLESGRGGGHHGGCGGLFVGESSGPPQNKPALSFEKFRKSPKMFQNFRKNLRKYSKRSSRD